MTGNVIVGFSSAAPGAGRGLVPVSGAADDGSGTGQLFQSLLDLVSGATPSASGAGGNAVITPLAAAMQSPPEDRPAAPTIGTGEPPAALALAPSEVEVPGEAGLLPALFEVLAALETALETGQPIDPTLRSKLADVLGRLDSLLDLDLPDPSAPALPEGAVPLALPAGPDALPAPGPQSRSVTATGVPTAAPAVPSGSTPAVTPTPETAAAPPAPTPPVPDAPAPTRPVTAPAVPPADPDPATAPTPGIATTAPAAAAEAPPPPDSAPAQLALRLENLASTLQPLAPELSRALDRLASRLLSGELPTATLARLGIAPDVTLADPSLARALETALQPQPTTAAPVAPKSFLDTELPLPAAMTQPPPDPERQTDTRPPSPLPASPDTPGLRVEADTDPSPRLAGDRPTDQPTRNLPAPAAGEPAAVADTRPTLPASGAGSTAVASTPLTAAADAQALQATYQAPPRQLNLPQLAFEVVRQFQAGNSRFQIRLDPPDLGRIDVRMDLDRDGNVNARMVVERVETLDLMQRDQRALERALAQAGLDGGKTSLEFSLRQNPFSQPGQGEAQDRPGQWAGNGEAGAESDDELPPAEATRYRGTAGAGGLNLFV